MSKINVQHFFDPVSNTFSYVIYDVVTKDAAVIDPVLDFDSASGCSHTQTASQMVSFITAEQLTLRYILETHVHADHLTAAPFIQSQCGGLIAIGNSITEVQTTFADIFALNPQFPCDGSQFDLLLEDGCELVLGGSTIEVLHTPGHTPACVSYLIEDRVFVGDTLFMPDYGTARCDFPGADPQQLFASIQRLFQLPDQTKIMLCHDYGTTTRPEYCYETTVAAQKDGNIHVAATTTATEFIAMRQQRDSSLAMPKLLFPSVQVNMRAGQWPEPEENGVRYLKLPINMFCK